MILLTGATGTIGRPLAVELKARGARLRVLTRDPERARNVLGPAEFVVGAVSSPESVAKALADVEAALLLLPLDPAMAGWAAEFARAAKTAGVRRIVQISAHGADVRSREPVARWHGDCEEMAARAGVPATVLRPAALYQNFLAHAEAMRRGTLSAPMGAAKIAMVDARDVAAAGAEALTSPGLAGRTLTLTGPASLSYADAADAFSRELGRPVRYRDVPPKEAERAMLDAGTPAWRMDALLTLAERFRSGRADELSDGVRTATGRGPTPFERFARDYASDFA